MKLKTENPIQKEIKAEKKQEFKFLGSNRKRKGLSLFALDFSNGELYQAEIQDVKTVQIGKKESHYKAVINPKHHHFWALNRKSALKKAIKLLKRAVK